MRRLPLFLILSAAAVAALALAAGRWGENRPGWDWGLAAEVGTAGGTTLLAIATFMLAYGTRRPQLTLDAGQAFATHSHIESNRVPHLRLLVRNKQGRRSAAGSRVLVDSYRRKDNSDRRTLGSPSLGWPSAPEATDASVVIFGGSGRPIGLGELWHVRSGPDGKYETAQLIVGESVVTLPAPTPEDDPSAEWHLKLSLSHGLFIGDHREFLAPGRWIISLIVGADEADGRSYDVEIEWQGDAPNGQAALDSVDIAVRRS